MVLGKLSQAEGISYSPLPIFTSVSSKLDSLEDRKGGEKRIGSETNLNVINEITDYHTIKESLPRNCLMRTPCHTIRAYLSAQVKKFLP
ncbi:uncharacterized protein CLUP02_12031 [Colletotrichum lupini]|uniref:Uncharacterized protein n=1 Tax=Colletotrichum lupini TaxID=145971 RepID=A0A9Q8WKB3_9PEZI|nr:uncharacterized protein CLUP02_12031 [Colletotrichum lupini]UQC86529.1 hypothetical protein CLUP02_12031 [Colletotrichum lupini]